MSVSTLLKPSDSIFMTQKVAESFLRLQKWFGKHPSRKDDIAWNLEEFSNSIIPGVPANFRWETFSENVKSVQN